MNQSNYALLTALYDTQDANFYKDIYFPIIKYGIFLLYRNQAALKKYYDTTNIQNVIIEKFGIKIPLIVIKQSLKIISNKHSDFSIELLSNGDQFSIKKIWEISISESIDQVYEQNLKHFTELQNSFAQYIETEQIQTDIKFIDFFASNTEDIYHYINNDTTSDLIVNENYIHITNFLQWLQRNNEVLYNIAADIFWGSVVAAFLQRETDLNIKPEIQICYYFDSSLVLALLDLDSHANHLYYQELLNMIKTSGHLPYVHPLTIKEIDSILFSVERDGTPKPNSGIAEAYDRRHLSSTQILHIRHQLKQLITDKGIYIEPCSDAKLDDIQQTYKSKPSVQQLASTRTNSYSSNIRDIHDVYMHDFIQSKNSKCLSIEKSNSFFVTANDDLIAYYNTQHSQESYIQAIIHPARIIMDLWIHNSQTNNIRRNALTEVIARCTALNQTDVKRKLLLISKHYKEDEFTKENYREVYTALMNRSKQVLSNIETLQDPKVNDEARSQCLAKIMQVAHQEEERRRDQNLANQQSVERLTSQHEIMLDKNARVLRILQLTNELNSCLEQAPTIDSTIKELETERASSVCMARYWIFIVFQAIPILYLLGYAVFYVCQHIRLATPLCEFISQRSAELATGCISILVTIATGSTQNLTILSPRVAYQDYKRKQEKRWERKHPEYAKKQQELINLNSKIQQLKDDINVLKEASQLTEE